MPSLTIQRIDGGLDTGNIDSFGINKKELNVEKSATESSQVSGSFSDILKKGIETVNQAQADSDKAIKETLAGRNKNIHETMLLIEKADMTYKLAMQVRNKIIDAYREVMKMQI